MLYMSPRRLDTSEPLFGYIVTPTGKTASKYFTRGWCLDNGAFTGKFNPERFVRYLRVNAPWKKWCHFAVAPDVVGDSSQTLLQFPMWRDIIQHHGYPVAFAAQDGCREIPKCDALFVGGSTEWKMSPDAVSLIREAKSRGVWVHVGRVNTRSRILTCRALGVDSVDGTSIAIAPKNALKILDWLTEPISESVYRSLP